MRLLVALVPLITACDTGLHFSGNGNPDAAITELCLEAENHSDFPWIRDNIFKVSCAAFSSCHQGSRPAGNLNLTPTQAYGALVDVPAHQVDNWIRVVRGDPDHSYLLVKLGDVPGPLGPQGDLMPPRQSALCAQKIAAIRRWIANGAHEFESADGGPDAGALDAAIADGPGPDATPDATASDAASEVADADVPDGEADASP